MTPIPLRETPLVRFIGYMLAFFSVGFAITTMWMGDTLTSKQWVYLMMIPGHKWSWGVLFLLSGIVTLIGLRRNHYRRIAFGHLGATVGCVSIGVFYIIGPFFESDLLTLGYWTWLFNAAIGFLLGAINWRPVTW